MSNYTRGQLEEIQAGVFMPEPVTITFDGTGNNGKVAAAAALTTALTGTNNDLTFTAANGIAGDDITVEYTTTRKQFGSPLEVEVSESAITVNLLTSLGVKASGVLTSDATNPTEDDTVTLGDVVYRFRDTLAQAYDVQIAATAALTLDNLKHAINATGVAGTNYFAGTLIHPTVTATTNTDTEQTVEAKTVGAAGNLIAKAESSSHLDWDGAGAFLTAGEDVGQILTIASEVDAAIDAHTAAAALVTPANAGGNNGTGVVTVMAATNLTGGSDGTVTLFTVEKDGLIALLGDCTTDLTGASATLEVGLTGNTAALIPQTTATTLDALERIDRSGVIATATTPNVTPFFPVRAGDVVKLTVGTASITAGVVDWQLFYKAFTSAAGSTGSSSSAADNLKDGLKLVTTAATRETLVAASTFCRSVCITAKQTNTGTIVVGGVTVVAASGATRRGTPLNAGDSTTISINDLVKVYLDSTVSGEGVTYTYLT